MHPWSHPVLELLDLGRAHPTKLVNLHIQDLTPVSQDEKQKSFVDMDALSFSLAEDSPVVPSQRRDGVGITSFPHIVHVVVLDHVVVVLPSRNEMEPNGL